MIRSWLRRRRPPADLVDAAVVVTAQIDVRDGQIEGLRDALAEARQQLEYERQVAAVLAGQLAAYKAREYMAAAARARRRLAEDTTLRDRKSVV